MVRKVVRLCGASVGTIIFLLFTYSSDWRFSVLQASKGSCMNGTAPHRTKAVAERAAYVSYVACRVQPFSQPETSGKARCIRLGVVDRSILFLQFIAGPASNIVVVVCWLGRVRTWSRGIFISHFHVFGEGAAVGGTPHSRGILSCMDVAVTFRLKALHRGGRGCTRWCCTL